MPSLKCPRCGGAAAWIVPKGLGCALRAVRKG